MYVNGYSEVYNLQIGKDKPSEDLDRVLRCLDKHIEELQHKLIGIERMIGSDPSSLQEGECKPKVFNISALSVSAKVGEKQKDYVPVRVTIKNKTTERMLLAINGDDNDSAVIIDEITGDSKNRAEIKGISTTISDDKKEKSYTPVYSDNFLHFSINFNQYKTSSKYFRLTIKLLRLKGEEPEHITASLCTVRED